MTETTVTIGDKDVVIEEVADGFVAREAEEKDDFVQYLEDEHVSEMNIRDFDGAATTHWEEHETRWSDGDAAVYVDYKNPHGAAANKMEPLDEDENVLICGTGVNAEKDRFEVHLQDER